MATLGASTLVLPQVGGDITLNRVNQDSYGSEYFQKSSLSEYVARIRHTKTKAGYDRHNVEVTQTIYATLTVPEYYRKFYFVLELLPSETSVDLADAVCDLAIASTDQVLKDLLNWIN